MPDEGEAQNLTAVHKPSSMHGLWSTTAATQKKYLGDHEIAIADVRMQYFVQWVHAERLRKGTDEEFGNYAYFQKSPVALKLNQRELNAE